MTFPPRFHSLQTQIILSILLAVVLAAAIAGIPTLWLIHQQLDRQAWAQVDSGLQAVRSLYESRQKGISDLARLTAQRPSLPALLAEGDPSKTLDYLRTLQSGESVDLIVLCDPGGQVLFSTGKPPTPDLCQELDVGAFYVLSPEVPPQVWLMASNPIPAWGSVVLGEQLDEDFVLQVRQQSGLEHAILVGGLTVATSYTAPAQNLTTLAPGESSLSTPDAAVCCTYRVENQPFYAARLWLGKGSLEAEVALPVTGIAATQTRMLWISAGSLAVIVLVGTALGAVLARRLSRPLEELAQAASRLSQGALSSPVEIDTQIMEVAQVSQALESARRDLEQTLGELQAEKDWVEHLLESIVEGIMTLDEAGRIAFFSHGAERITGWSRDEVLGRPCNLVFQVAGEGLLFCDLLPAPGQKNNIVVRGASGEATLSVTRAQLTPAGDGAGEAAIVFRDVSQEETVHRLLGFFIANVAHEFRTPLSALAASAELLMDQAPDLSPAEMGELLRALHLGVLGLQTLVDNLLESASIEAGHFRVSPRPSDLKKIIAEAVATMRPLLEKYNQQLVEAMPPELPDIQADPRRVAQVLVNLLSNASKYGPSDEEIELTTTLEGDWVRMAVADRGPGISGGRRDTVFRRFEYPSAVEGPAKVGAGLGLSVVKAIVEAHGGQAEVEDRPGGGSIFWFTLPVAREV
jgi:signal transduction histidine kinase/HAMP domain-containing protein